MIHVIADELYSIFPKDQMNSKKSYLTMRSFVQSIDNGFYRYWYAHRDSMINFEEGKYKGRELETLKIYLLDLSIVLSPKVEYAKSRRS